MNYDKLAANSLYNKISKLEIQLKNQKEQTNTAQEEAKNQRNKNYQNLAAQCINFIKTPTEAPSEKLST